MRDTKNPGGPNRAARASDGPIEKFWKSAKGRALEGDVARAAKQWGRIFNHPEWRDEPKGEKPNG